MDSGLFKEHMQLYSNGGCGDRGGPGGKGKGSV